MTRRIAILGAGGFAREVLDVYEARREAGDDVEVEGFIVDESFGVPGAIVNDRPILGGLEWLADHIADVYAICAVGHPAVRQNMVARCLAIGARFDTVVHPRATLTRRVEIGAGTVVTAGVVLTNNIEIGDHVHVNLNVTIGHDAVISRLVTLSPGVHVSGRVKIGAGTFVGTGAVILERLTLGEWSTVGAGSVVNRDVDANTTVVGVPAREIKRKQSGWHLG